MPADTSPSPRRAWIEMVDAVVTYFAGASPSPRRAWIEMDSLDFRNLKFYTVALPTEGVD